MSTVKSLAINPDVNSEDIAVAIDFIEKIIAEAKAEGRPVPFEAYRSRMVMEMALHIRSVKAREEAWNRIRAKENCIVQNLDDAIFGYKKPPTP